MSKLQHTRPHAHIPKQPHHRINTTHPTQNTPSRPLSPPTTDRDAAQLNFRIIQTIAHFNAFTTHLNHRLIHHMYSKFQNNQTNPIKPTHKSPKQPQITPIHTKSTTHTFNTISMHPYSSHHHAHDEINQYGRCQLYFSTIIPVSSISTTTLTCKLEQTKQHPALHRISWIITQIIPINIRLQPQSE